jgi:hypothetical protein
VGILAAVSPAHIRSFPTPPRRCSCSAWASRDWQRGADGADNVGDRSVQSLLGGQWKVAMPNPYLAAFIDRLSQMDDESLLRTLVRMAAAPGEYQPEGIAAVYDEIARRGLTPAQQREAVSRVKQEALESLYDDAVGLALQGRSVPYIEANLKARGMDGVSAAATAKRAWDMPTEQRKRAGRRNMISGATFCLVGILFTAAACYVAGTGPMAIVWGLVLVGLLQFFRGVGQSTR